MVALPFHNPLTLSIDADGKPPHSDERSALIQRARTATTAERRAVEGLSALLSDLGAERWALVEGGEVLVSSSASWDELTPEEASICLEAARRGGWRGAKRGDGQGRWWRAVLVAGSTGSVILALMRGAGKRPPEQGREAHSWTAR